MFSKLSNKTLIILMVLLGSIVVWTYFSEDQKSESTFREIFLELDTAQVNEIRIYPQSAGREEIKIFKSGSAWRVKDKKQEAPVDDQTVAALLNTFSNMKTKSLAASSPEQWNTYQAGDTSGNRIVFVTPSKTYDIIVGKFSFDNETRSATSFVRHKGEKEIYAVEGFLAFSINQPFDSWRNKSLIKKGDGEWTSIRFNYPADSGFVITKDSASWILDGSAAAHAENYIGEIAHLSGQHFDDQQTGFNTLYSVVIEGNNMNAITVEFSPADSVKKYYVKSSLNPETVFTDNDLSLFNRLLKSRHYFSTQNP